MGIHWPWRAELSSLSWILVCLLMNLRLRCLNSRFWTSTSPQKCDLRCDCSEDLLDNRKKSLKCITPLDVPFEKRAQTMVFYDNRDLSIVKFKKSEKYIREKFEIFIRLFNGNFASAGHFESHWRERWRHTVSKTESLIPLETPPLWLFFIFNFFWKRKQRSAIRIKRTFIIASTGKCIHNNYSPKWMWPVVIHH